MSRKEPGQDDGDLLRSCEEQVKSLEDLLDEKTSPEEPVLGDLHRQIQQHLSRLQATRVDTTGTAAEPESNVKAERAPTISVKTTTPESIF